MNNWRVIGYVFLGCGSVLLIYALFAFFGMLSVIPQTPYLAQALTSAALAAIAPYLILGTLAYVIGSVGYYAGQEKTATPISSNKSNVTISATLDKIDRLEGTVDNNFNVITKRLDEIEEKQNMDSQNIIIEAKKD